MILAEAHVQSLGILGVPGVIALGAGAMLAVGGLGGGFAAALVIALVLVVSSGALLALSLRKGLAVRRRRIRGGSHGLIGHVGVVRSWSQPTGKVLVDGGLWQARRSWGDDEETELHEGDKVVVEQLKGLTLSVRKAEEWEW